jgi:beta-N-acetylhexosaminidase
VAGLRSWTASAVPDHGTAAGRLANAGAGRPDSGPAGAADGQVGLIAARRAVLSIGPPAHLHRPFVVQLVPPDNMAAGAVPWGISSWLPADSTRQVSAETPPEELPAAADRLLAAAAGRSLVIVVRDAHRYPAAAGLASLLLAARPDATVVEMGLPIWRPAAARYLASYGAGRNNALAIAQMLGLPGAIPA